MNGIQLQALRIPAGWSISWNSFFDLEPNEEFVSYFGTYLITGFNPTLELYFELKYEPEDVPFGDFILILMDTQIAFDDPDLIDIIKTKSKQSVIKSLEEFMLNGKQGFLKL